MVYTHRSRLKRLPRRIGAAINRSPSGERVLVGAGFCHASSRFEPAPPPALRSVSNRPLIALRSELATARMQLMQPDFGAGGGLRNSLTSSFDSTLTPALLKSSERADRKLGEGCGNCAFRAISATLPVAALSQTTRWPTVTCMLLSSTKDRKHAAYGATDVLQFCSAYLTQGDANSTCMQPNRVCRSRRCCVARFEENVRQASDSAAT